MRGQTLCWDTGKPGFDGLLYGLREFIAEVAFATVGNRGWGHACQGLTLHPLVASVWLWTDLGGTGGAVRPHGVPGDLRGSYFS